MAIITLRNVPNFGDVPINTDWPPEIIKMWKDALGEFFDSMITGASGAWVPTFEAQHYSQLPDSPPVPLAITDFATSDTAQEVAKRTGSSVASVKLPYGGGSQWWVVFSDGTAIVAGRLADQWLRNPEDQFPNVAKNAVDHDIATARAAGQRLPPDAI